MSSELSMKEIQMKALTEKIQTLLKGLDKSKRVELDLAEISSSLRSFQTSLDSAQLESKKSDSSKQSLREHKNTLKELTSEYEKRKAASNSKMLMSGANSSSTYGDISTASGLMKHGLTVQDKSTESLSRTLRAIREAKGIGEDTVAKLETDTHRMAALSENLFSIDTTLERSTKTIKRIARNN